MATIFTDSATFGSVPQFDGSFACAHCNLRAVAVPVKTRDGLRCEFTELEDSVVVGVPEVE